MPFDNQIVYKCFDHFLYFEFQILSQITGKAVTDVMAPHKDVLQDMIPPKKHLLRHQPVNAQVHYANPSINLCSYLLLSEGRQFIVQDLFVLITRKSKNDWLVKVGTHSLCTLLLHTKAMTILRVVGTGQVHLFMSICSGINLLMLRYIVDQWVNTTMTSPVIKFELKFLMSQI